MKKVKSGLKKLAKSKLFKVVLIAAAIYTGGAALGYWKAAGALSRVNGVLAVGGKAGAAGAASTAATTAGTTAAAGTTLAPGAGVLAAGNGGLALAAPTAGEALASSVIPSAVGGTAATVAPAVAGSAVMAPGGVGAAAETGVKKGVISRMMDSQVVNAMQKTGGEVLKVADKHPALAQAAFTGIASALSPDEIDILKAKQELELDADAKERERRNQNLNVSGIKINPLELQPLKYASTGQQAYSGGVLSKMNTTR